LRHPQRKFLRRKAGLLACAVVVASLATPSVAQVRPANYVMKSNQTSKRGIGSAKRLSGITHVYHIFCNDAKSSWSPSERSDVLQRMQDGCRFISSESRRHQVGVTFVDHVGASVRVKGAIPEKVQVNHVWTENVIRKAARCAASELVKRTKNGHGTDNVMICLHVNKAALSYNLAFYDNVDRIYEAERMVCFSSYPDGRETAAATYAHEVLHLFGAGDLYFPYDRDVDRKNRAAQLFPNDVMYRVDYDLGRLDVGPYTAFRVGWISRLDPRYEVFND
jgi:hypothetical protein